MGNGVNVYKDYINLPVDLMLSLDCCSAYAFVTRQCEFLFHLQDSQVQDKQDNYWLFDIKRKEKKKEKWEERNRERYIKRKRKRKRETILP